MVINLENRYLSPFNAGRFLASLTRPVLRPCPVAQTCAWTKFSSPTMAWSARIIWPTASSSPNISCSTRQFYQHSYYDKFIEKKHNKTIFRYRYFNLLRRAVFGSGYPEFWPNLDPRVMLSFFAIILKL